MTSDAKWAQSSLIDPLTEPDPSDETGLNTHYRSTFAPATPEPGASASKEIGHGSPKEVRKQTTGSSTLSSNNPFRQPDMRPKDSASVNQKEIGRGAYPSPPASASPRRERFPPSYREQAFGGHQSSRPRAASNPQHGRAPQSPSQGGSGITRGNSLRQKYPNDPSVHPYDQIKRETKLAHRSPHLRKKQLPGADMIDKLDSITGPYHHEGPYDATLMSRNLSYTSSPVAAVASTNEEALKATPAENIQDSIERHRPLQGVAVIPPGETDRFGRKYEYEEGTDLMIEGGYKRWTNGVDYLPEDLKGKGEPSYSIEKALKEHKKNGVGEDSGAIEMTTRSPVRHSIDGASTRRSIDGAAQGASTGQSYSEWEGGMRRSSSKRLSGEIKKRFGSLRKRRGE